MSRSKPSTRVPSPIKHYFEWSGSEGKFQFYDKDKKANIMFPKLSFIVLDELHTVTGFVSKEKGSYRGSKVKDLSEPIKVWLGKSLVAEAPYKALKELTGLKYAKVLIIGIISAKKPMELAELTLKGSSFSSWLDFQKAEKDYEKGSKVDIFSDIGIAVNGKSELKVNGSSKYYEPVYEVIKVTDDQMATATSLDVTYQEYLGSAPSKSDDHEPEERLILPEVPGESETPEDLVPSGDEDDYDDDLPF